MPQTIQQANQELAQSISEQARRDPGSPYAGKFVGIISGQVVAVAENLDDLVRSVRQLEPDHTKILCLEAGLDYGTVQQIWSV